MPGILPRLVDWLWSAFAAALIALAALVTVVRLLLPHIDGQRAAIETWIGEAVGRPATVGHIAASWDGWSPRIRVDDIAILDAERHAELVRFDRAVISLTPLGLIAGTGLEPQRLELHGIELTLIRDRDGRISVAGLPPSRSPLLQWLVHQEDFAITGADLRFIDEGLGENVLLSDVTLTIRGREGRRLIAAFAELPQHIGRQLAVELEADGDPLAPDWEGRLDLRLDGADSAWLTRALELPAIGTPGAPVDLAAWSTWRNGRLDAADFAVTAAAPGAPAPVFTAQGHFHRRVQGWGLELADIVFATDDGGGGPGRARAAWRSADDGLQAVVLEADGLPLAPLAALLAQTAPATAELRPLVAASAPRGRIERLAAAWRPPAADGAPRYYAEAAVAGVTTADTAARPGVEGLGALARFGARNGYLEFRDAAFTLRWPERLLEPLAVRDFDGVIAWTRSPETLTAAAHGVEGRIDGAALTVEGELGFARGLVPRTADLLVTLADVDAARFHLLLPTGVLPEKGEEWARHLLHAGRIPWVRAELRGPLAEFPFRASADAGPGADDGTPASRFAFDFEVADATVQYSRAWPLATGFAGEVRMRGATAALHIASGLIGGADIGGAEVTMPDLFTHERQLRISGTARGPARSATDIVMASPLKAGKAARLEDLEISGDIEVTLDMNLSLHPDGPDEVLGQARFDGNRITAVAEKVTLDHVGGAVSFTRRDWYGANLTAVFEGTPVGLVVNGGLDDPNYDSEFRMTGTSPAARFIDYLDKYAPPVHAWLAANDRLGAIDGELPWKAVLTIPSTDGRAGTMPRLLTLESSLLGLAIDLPWPLGKRADERTPLRIETAILDHVPLATRIDFGDTMDIELEAAPDADGTPRLVRAEVLFGALTPEFKGRPGVTLAGYIALLPLSEWTTFLQRMHHPPQADGADLPVSYDVQVGDLRLLGRKFEDVRLRGARGEQAWRVNVTSIDASGDIEIPRDAARGVLRFDLEHLRLVRAGKSHKHAALDDLDPRLIPALELDCASFHFGETDLGRAQVRTARRANGLRLESLSFAGSDFSITGNGDWLIEGSAQTSIFHIDVRSSALGALLQRFGYTGANIRQGETDIAIEASWDGTPADFSLAGLSGSFSLNVTDGRLLDIEPGSGRLFGLLSLQTLPRRLLFDFDDLFEKGFAFDRIGGVFELDGGNAYTNSLLMEGPAARIDISGRTGLADKDYDQQVVVTPALSNSLPLAGALFGPIGAGAGAVYFLGQKMFKSIPEQVNRFLTRRYAITGSWDNPVVERI
jgi:uncharacterized protein (TIGR02099 family)